MLERVAGSYSHWCFTAASGDQLRVVPERGGLVTGWKADGQERLYFDHERFVDPAKSVRGGIPVLFPICGNLPGDQLELPQGGFPMAQHGFARDLPWQLQALDDASGLELSLGHSEATLAHYPFPFALRLRYQLESSALAITAEVEQLASGTVAMPFSLGLHPYFSVSALENAAVEGLPNTCLNHLTMAAANTAEQLQRLPEGIDLLAEPAAAVRLIDCGSGSAVELEPEPPLNLAVVWTDPPRPMVCLEPWTAPRGSLASGDRCLWLQPGERQQLRCRYQLLQA
jgi:galactose mutarotase-like enzyme